MRTSRVLLILACGAAIGLAVFGALVYRAVDVNHASASEARERFDQVRDIFADQQPLIAVSASGDITRRAAAVVSSPPTLSRLEVLAYRSADARLVEAHVPFWFFRLKRPALQFAVRGTGLDLDHLQITAKALSARGPGLVLDQAFANGDRLLVWTE